MFKLNCFKTSSIMIKNVLLSLFLCLCLYACSDIAEDSSVNQLDDVELTLTDSIPLYNDQMAFSSLFLRNIKENKVFGYTYPLVDLSELDLKTREVTTISMKGDGPTEFKNSVEAVLALDGNLYVIEQYNESRLLIFNSAYKHQKTIVLTDYISGYYPKSNFNFLQIRSLDENTFRIYISLSQYNFSNDDMQYYDGFGITEIDINRKTFEVENVGFHLKYTDIPPINKRLNSGEKTWYTINPIFHVAENSIFVYYPTTSVIYQYDFSWNLVKEIAINFEFSNYVYSRDFKDIYETQKRIYEQKKAWFGNYYMTHLEVKDNRIYFTYRKPVTLDQIPEGIMELPPNDRVFHIIDLETNLQYSYQPDFVQGIGSLFSINGDMGYFLGKTPKNQEDYVLYKYQINLLN